MNFREEQKLEELKQQDNFNEDCNRLEELRLQMRLAQAKEFLEGL